MRSFSRIRQGPGDSETILSSAPVHKQTAKYEQDGPERYQR
ncbi:unnamed protein product [marine sediment metagenome]|uniref:Uncharacterized protein n=1 Tax=marine sediment metagenome TaxID=412755 RepID=X1TDX0_9ZZZZ